MKTLLLLTSLLFTLNCISSGAGHEVLPDLSKAFPKEKLIHKEISDQVESYLYESDLKYETLKKIFIEFLGQGWIEVKADPKVKNAANDAMKGQGIVMVKNTKFSHVKFPNVSIGFVQLKMDNEAKDFVVSAVLIREDINRSSDDQKRTEIQDVEEPCHWPEIKLLDKKK